MRGIGTYLQLDLPEFKCCIAYAEQGRAPEPRIKVDTRRRDDPASSQTPGKQCLEVRVWTQQGPTFSIIHDGNSFAYAHPGGGPARPVARRVSRAMGRSLRVCTPIRFTSAGEPHIPLPAPFERFYLCVMRHSDTPHDVAMMAHGSEVYVGQVTPFYCGDDMMRSSPVNYGWEEWYTRALKVWGIGAAIHPDYWSTGLAWAGVNIILHDWAIAPTGCTELCAECFASNLGSVKLWESLASSIEEPALRGTVAVSEAIGGGQEPGVVFVWSLKSPVESLVHLRMKEYSAFRCHCPGVALGAHSHPAFFVLALISDAVSILGSS
ncbi:hypothetical protein C8R44DRAFT_855971 [Mycena epipterygia]|nr:hypothetical protein C8R44DRAFT_855971 [Mycena epipterygia]